MRVGRRATVAQNAEKVHAGSDIMVFVEPTQNQADGYIVMATL